MNDDVERFYTNPIPNGRRSRWLSGLKREVFGGAFRYRIGIGFVGIVIQNLIVCGMDPIPILYQNAPLKVVLFCRKSLSRAERPENFEEDRAPVRSILEILKKIPLPRGAS